ncbi:MAG: 2,3-bisphosphoglycerate-dependent phosphoglycerate mutase [Candidatus Kapaibacteriales bacterium]
MPKLITVRHGQSQWNLENRFTGWTDIDLTEKGKEEAREAGELIKGISVDKVFTSALIRAQHTAKIICEVAGIELNHIKEKALNERHYGDLQGMNKDETRKKFGDEQVHIWRRSYDTPPPGGESLKMTQERVIPYYKSDILPELRKGNDVLVVAHGNSLRALIMELNKITPEDILKLNIPTGKPYLYDMDADINIYNHGYLPDLSEKI